MLEEDRWVKESPDGKYLLIGETDWHSSDAKRTVMLEKLDTKKLRRGRRRIDEIKKQ